MNQDRKPVELGEIARVVEGKLVGDGSLKIRGMAPPDKATREDLVFLDPKNPDMVASLPRCGAGAVIVDSGMGLPPGLSAIRIDPPHLGLARALDFLYPRRRSVPGISPAAMVSPSARVAADAAIDPGASIGEGARIGSRTEIHPHVSIGAGVTVGEDCIIYPNVTVYDGCEIGNRVIIHAGAVIGADGFGFTPEPVKGNPREPFRHRKIAQVGKVVIEDDVEIGANSTIDRATLDATVIGRGTKIDNLVMVAHNCTIGPHTILVSQCGLSGSTTVGSYVTIAGQAGLVGHIRVGDRAVITAKAGVTKDVEEGKVLIGAPAMDIREGRLAFGLISHLPKFKKAIADLMKRVEELEKKSGGA
jgi:UDP-3-O-[3-hydroxymyristoyl] glucosamine N-acyltransferase